MQDKFSIAQREKPINDCIPFAGLVSPSIIVCRNGELISTLKINGIAFETNDDDLLDLASEQLNVFYRSIASNDVALQVHRLRRPCQDELTVPYANESSVFAQSLTQKYNAIIGKSSLMTTELYITVIERIPKRIKKIMNPSVLKEEFEERLDRFQALVNNIENAFQRYGVSRLEEYEKDGERYSNQLSFYNFLITGVWQPVKVPNGLIYESLGNVQVFEGADFLQLQTPSGSRYCQSVEIKDYPQFSNNQILNNLFYKDLNGHSYCFVETVTFAFLSKSQGQKALELQKRQLLASQDAGITQVEAMDLALDKLINGEFIIGECSYSLLIYGDSTEETRKNTQDACKKLADKGFLPVISTLALMAAYLSQFPTNFSFRTRQAKLSSLNFAHLAPFHNFPSGKRDGNPWGEAVCLLKTTADQPYYFNFHTSPINQNSFDLKTLANTTIIGTSGSGKTASMTFLLGMLQKYRTPKHKLTTIYFDKDRGAEIAIRAINGGYLTVENGQPTGFNPFQLENTKSNVQFLNQFMRLILRMDGRDITPEDDARLSQAIESVMAMPKEIRRMGLLLENMTEGASREEIINSLKKRLAKWVNGGELSWVFDNPTDTLDFDRYPNFGIDGTDFLDNKEIRSPIAFYLLYRMEQVIDGRRFVFIMDEFWKWLLDEAFSDFAFNKLKTIRKQNGFGVFLTQSPSDVIQSPIAKAVIEQSATQIFLPNPKATIEDYVDGFKVTETEFEIIRRLPDDSRLMLIKQGFNSVLCRLDLSDFKQELKVLSGSTDSIQRLYQIMDQVGQNPTDWLPIFYGANEHA